jgi:hypothetical protein
MFATTKALAFQRSAELARSFKNTVFEDGGVQNTSRRNFYRKPIISYYNISGG